MPKEELVELLDQEIRWCELHQNKNLSINYRNGFIAGLKQARNFVYCTFKEEK